MNPNDLGDPLIFLLAPPTRPYYRLINVLFPGIPKRNGQISIEFAVDGRSPQRMFPFFMKVNIFFL